MALWARVRLPFDRAANDAAKSCLPAGSRYSAPSDPDDVGIRSRFFAALRMRSLRMTVPA